MNKMKYKKTGKHSKEGWRLTLMALPFVIYIFLFKYVPLLGWSLAFTNYKPGRSLDKLQFVGLKYFKLVQYYWPEIRIALRNTMVVSLAYILFMFLPMFFAVALNEFSRQRVKKTIQTIVTLPHFVSWVIVFAITFGLFSSNGLVNTIMKSVGLISKPWTPLSSLNAAWPMAIILDIWKNMGWESIIYMAAIAGIDPSLYEAAQIDGANRWQCIRYMTLPSLMPTYLVLLVLSIGGILNGGLDKYMLYSNSVTSSHLEVLDLFVYRVGILTQDYTFAIAVGVLKSLISIGLVLFANALAKKMRGRTVI